MAKENAMHQGGIESDFNSTIIFIVESILKRYGMMHHRKSNSINCKIYCKQDHEEKHYTTDREYCR
jgi:hypothetical protein